MSTPEVSHDEQQLAALELQLQPARISLRGELRRGRGGPLHVAQLVSGVAVLRWLFELLVALLGYRHRGLVRLGRGTIEVRGLRRLMGLSLGDTHLLVPLSAVRRVALVGQSAFWAVASAVAVLLVASAAGGVLVLWGVAGGQPSWTAAGLLVIGLGLAVDAAAYLSVRRAHRRNRATLSIQAQGSRVCLSGVDFLQAEQLVQEVNEQLSGGDE